jgi:hypothetical protein
MFYIGHFSFDEIDADGNQRHGYFSAIVESQTPDAAVAMSMSCKIDSLARFRLATPTPSIFRAPGENRWGPWQQCVSSRCMGMVTGN